MCPICGTRLTILMGDIYCYRCKRYFYDDMEKDYAGMQETSQLSRET